MIRYDLRDLSNFDNPRDDRRLGFGLFDPEDPNDFTPFRRPTLSPERAALDGGELSSAPSSGAAHPLTDKAARAGSPSGH